MSVSVQTADFDLSAEVARLTDGRTDIGAIVTFTGTKNSFRIFATAASSNDSWAIT